MTCTDVSGAPLRIGLLHQYRLETSGSGIYLRRLAGHLLGRGHAVSLMSHDPKLAVSAVSVGSAGRSGGHVACKTHSLRGAGTPVAYPGPRSPAVRCSATCQTRTSRPT
jgi:hypothetical protein